MCTKGLLKEKQLPTALIFHYLLLTNLKLKKKYKKSISPSIYLIEGSNELLMEK